MSNNETRYADDYRVTDDRLKALTEFLNKHSIPSGEHEESEDLAPYLLEREEELLAALGFEKVHGYGSREVFWEAPDEEHARFNSDRKGGADRAERWQRTDWYLREYGDYDRISKIWKERQARKDERDAKIAAAAAAINAEYADVKD